MKQKTVQVAIDIPEGWEVAKCTTTYYDWNPANQLHSPMVNLVIRREVKWRPATVADVIASIGGRHMQSRFRDNDAGQWVSYNCGPRGCDKEPVEFWVDIDGQSWRQCEVQEIQEDN